MRTLPALALMATSPLWPAGNAFRACPDDTEVAAYLDDYHQATATKGSANQRRIASWRPRATD
jgi:hypothetical protein